MARCGTVRAGRGSFAVRVSAADATGGPERAEFPDATGPGGVVTAELAGPYQYEHSYTFGPSSTASGVYTVTVYDAAGHSTPVGFAVARDAQPPTATVQAPRVVVSPTFTVQWTAGDGGAGLGGVYDVQVRVGGGAWSDWMPTTATASGCARGTGWATSGSIPTSPTRRPTCGRR